MPTWRRITSRRAGARPHDSHVCVSPNVKPSWRCVSCCSIGTPPSEENGYELTIGAGRSFLEAKSATVRRLCLDALELDVDGAGGPREAVVRCPTEPSEALLR